MIIVFEQAWTSCKNTWKLHQTPKQSNECTQIWGSEIDPKATTTITVITQLLLFIQ